jgi:hypothetical protein
MRNPRIQDAATATKTGKAADQPSDFVSAAKPIMLTAVSRLTKIAAKKTISARRTV